MKGEIVVKGATVGIDEKVVIAENTQRRNLVEVLIGTQEIDTTLKKEIGTTKRSVVGMRTIIVKSTAAGRTKTTTEAGKNGTDCSFYFKLN